MKIQMTMGNIDLVVEKFKSVLSKEWIVTKGQNYDESIIIFTTEDFTQQHIFNPVEYFSEDNTFNLFQ